MPETKRISNELEDFEQAGLYPGGKGVIKDIRYVLWDYGGKQPPNSSVAVNMHFQPSDGSNEGKEVTDIFWNVGKATDFQPDATGGHLLGIGTANGIRLGSNWHFVAEKLRNQCGLPKGKLSGDEGLRVLIGAEMTLTRVDPPERDFGDDQKDRKKTKILVPTYAKFPWEMKGGVAARPAAAGTPAAVANNGAAAVSFDLASAIAEVAMEAGGSIGLDDIAKAVLPKMANVPSKDRVPFIKQAKDVAELETMALANNWTLNKEGKTLSVV